MRTITEMDANAPAFGLGTDDLYNFKPVDNFDLSLNISEPDTCGSPTGYMAVDQTFHTPSFGDEEFEIPPLSLQPTILQNNRNNIMYNTQTLSHHHHQQSQGQQMQQAPSCNQSMVMPVERMMESPPQYHGPPQDVYLQQIGDVLPPQQSINIQVQHGYDAQYNNHRMHMEQMQQHSMMRQTHMRNMAHHQQQHPPTSVMNCHSPLLTTISQSQLSNQLGMHVRMSQQGPGSVGSSPPGSTHTSPCHETSEDSDDSTPLSQQLIGSMKRPSPEPVETCLKMMNNNIKKPKVQKKKKKRDPNEPQKPVSAYALFFRDTQAAIKGQNPNASFGEVSKIVASMWDSLDVEHKNVYKKKTEAAKKEYLKALAAYRASLVSKAAADQSDSLYGNSVSSTTINTTVSSSSPGHQHSLSPLQKKSPLLTSLMEGTAPPPGTTLQSMTQPQQPMLNSQHPMNTTTTMVHQQGQMGQMIHTPAGHQMSHQMVHMGNGIGCSPPDQQQQQNVQNVSQPVSNSPNYTQNMSISMSPMGLGNNQGGLATQGMVNQSMSQTCLRNGCTNPAVDSPDWDREYCSSECVVSHCRDVFSAWVASRQANNSFASVK